MEWSLGLKGALAFKEERDYRSVCVCVCVCVVLCLYIDPWSKTFGPIISGKEAAEREKEKILANEY